MYSTIVVATDGSDTAAGAVSAAAELARTCGASVHLVKAFQTSVTDCCRADRHGRRSGPRHGGGGPSGRPAASEVLTDAARVFEGLRVQWHTGKGATGDVIVALAEQVGADLIVVGSKGMQRRILGSIPNTVAHNAPCAVLIVKTT